MPKTETKAPAQKRVSLAKILLATDFSPVSDRALDFAASIARAFDSRIYLTHIITLDTYPNWEDSRWRAPEIATTTETKENIRTRVEFDKIEKSGRLNGIPHEAVIGEGALWVAIEGLVEKFGIDLVVLGTHGASGLKKVLLGSGAEEVFRHCHVPVLTIGPAVKDVTSAGAQFKNILFATEFAPSVEREAAFAVSLAQEHEAKLTLLHVIPYLEEYSESAVQAKRKEVTAQLRELVLEESEIWCKPEFLMVIGDPVEEILKYAAESNADLIVMGAKKREKLAGYLPHTKAFRVVTAAKCPVLTVRS
jgi:nucleotide-binding universal stress UspA family protein